MKKTKGLFYASLALSIGFTSFIAPTSSLAQTQDAPAIKKTTGESKIKDVKKYNEITDLNVLYERAKINKQDFKDSLKFKSEAKITPIQQGVAISESTSNTLNADDYQTSQLLEEITYADGTKSKTYVVTNLAVIQEAENDSKKGIVALADKYREKWDDTGGLKAYSRLYINETSGWISLSSVQGGWQIADSSYTIPNRRVRLNQSGVGVNGAVMKQQDYYPGGLTFNYTAPSWPKVSTITSGAGQAYVGAGQYVTIKRGGSSWQFSWSNNF